MRKTVTTYQEMHGWATGFARGALPVLITVGNPGIGKSRVTREAVGDRARVIEGRATAFQMYCDLYRHRDAPFIIDDIDDLYQNRDAVRLLKCLCQSDEEKRLAWHSAARGLDEQGVPRQFSTRTRCAILANEWRNLNRNIGAVEDRGVLVHFRPTPEEVHAWVETWRRDRKVDEQVFRFIEAHLPLIAEPSARHYLNASMAKRAGLDWRGALRETWGLCDDVVVLRDLLANDTLSPHQRQEQFTQRTGRSRATYFRLLRALRRADPAGRHAGHHPSGGR